jgi:diaminopimelate decarboxylase
MDEFAYGSADQGGGREEMACEGVALRTIADAVGTPVYVYAQGRIERSYRAFRDAFSRPPLIAYAVKANPNLAVISTLAALGAGADTVSEGEIRRALAAGVPGERIIFSGVGKTDAELAFALDVGVGEINVESRPELLRLSRVAEAKGRPAPVAIRVNPGVGAGAHDKIATGRIEDKFGVSLAEAEALYGTAAADPWLSPFGVACHIGSQILSLEPMRQAFLKMRALVERLRASGLRVERLDLGGGLGAAYFDGPEPPPPSAFATMVEAVTEGLQIELSFEPGRVIVANAGVLVARVIHVHERAEGRRFLVLDAAMNDLIRPAMYEAFHDIRPVIKPETMEPLKSYDVVGPVCETSDTFARDRALAPLEAGDLVAVMSAGAYGASMASEYNSRLLIPEVLAAGGTWAVVRPRPTYAAMLARESPAPWQGLEPAPEKEADAVAARRPPLP